MKNNKCIAIIPARGGSKRIPGKNIKFFNGKPIISYSIEAAIKSELFDDVMVSTDSMEIAEIARQYGACVPFMREADIAKDGVPTSDVLLNVLQNYEERGKTYQYMACIYPTAPFVKPETLKRAMKILLANVEATMVIPLVAFSYPPQRCYVIDKDGMAVFRNPEYIFSRSQDLETYYHDVGQYYIYNVEKFIAANGRICNNIIPIFTRVCLKTKYCTIAPAFIK